MKTGMEKKNDHIQISDLNAPGISRCKKLAFWIFLMAVICGGFFSAIDSNGEVAEYKTHRVCPGNFTIRVTASGTLQPKNKVIVGCELSGTIDRIYKDYNDRVEKGELLASLLTDELKARVRQLSAALDSAQANVRKGEVELKDKVNEFRRMNRLRADKAISRKSLERAQTEKEIAEAVLLELHSQVKQAEANLNEAEVNLKKASVISPISGLVLSRHVESGQAVSSNLQTPHLFTLATNLREMRLELNIDEADVGKVKPGQKASFTVDAYPSRSFQAELIKLRYAPQRVQGVVTYVGIFSVENDDLALRPGMTASADIVIRRVHDRLVIPNSALRYRPPGVKDVGDKAGNTSSVWVLRGGFPQKAAISKGGTDGRMTEVLDGELIEGDEVILSKLEPNEESGLVLSF